jgi:hypothetical protein
MNQKYVPVIPKTYNLSHGYTFNPRFSRRNTSLNHHYVFQQGGTPAQDSKRMQDWLKESFTEVWVEEVWPPCSPYGNPFDFFCGASMN